MKKRSSQKKRTAKRVPKRQKSRATSVASGPVSLAQARVMVRGPAPRRALRSPSALPSASPADVGVEKKKLELERRQEKKRRIREYRDTLRVMKQRGVKGLMSGAAVSAATGRRAASKRRSAQGQPLQIFAEGDSWFDYPYPLFGGSIVPRLEDKLGVPILNLAKAGDEVRFMLGVEERKTLIQQLTNGCPAGGPWDVLLFSGGGNDIVDNPMALWVRDYNPAVPPSSLIHQARYDAALALVRAGYEDLIALRNSLSPSTHLIFHAYDFAIPDGRGACHLGPWLKPTFDLRKFPKFSTSPAAFEVVKTMLLKFAKVLQALERGNKGITFVNSQGVMPAQTGSWHNELHLSKTGFDRHAENIHQALKALFPHRVL